MGFKSSVCLVRSGNNWFPSDLKAREMTAGSYAIWCLPTVQPLDDPHTSTSDLSRGSRPHAVYVKRVVTVMISLCSTLQLCALRHRHDPPHLVSHSSQSTSL